MRGQRGPGVLARWMVVAALAAAPAPLAPQEVRLEEVNCPGCRLELHRVVELGDAQGPGRLDQTLASWAADSRGRILLASGWQVPVRVFGADGRFAGTIQPTLPGDTLPLSIGLVAVTAGDTVNLVDDLRGLHLVLHADGNLVRTHTPTPLRPASMRLLLPGGRAVGTGTVATRDNVGYPLHLLGPDGAVLRSFGADVAEDVPGQSMDLRKLALAGPDAVWAGHLTRFGIERWTLDGERQAALVRDVPWFAPYTDMRWRPDQAPHPILMALRQDAAGRLWSVVRVADERWRDARPLIADTLLARRNPAAQYDPEELYDTMVEVIDPACGRVLLSRRFPGLIAGFLDDGRMVSWSDRPGAHPRLTVWRVDAAFDGAPACAVGGERPLSQ
ncbi:hypothetical protein [Longimicrobium sp.]|uniref:hypothetical protein n=1 Tax=Longimicrobium sp. TaxID=2029185 RepID=UPI003B3A98B0